MSSSKSQMRAKALSVKGKTARARKTAKARSNPVASPSMREFRRQKAAFARIPQAALKAYVGSYVASIDGTVVDSDVDLPRLTSRFFAARGHIPVYIGFVGQRTLVIETPS